MDGKWSTDTRATQKQDKQENGIVEMYGENEGWVWNQKCQTNLKCSTPQLRGANWTVRIFRQDTWDMDSSAASYGIFSVVPRMTSCIPILSL